MIAITYKQLLALKPCRENLSIVTDKLGKWDGTVSAADAVKAGVSFYNIVWVASAVARKDKDVERKLRLWMADCAARVLPVYERDYQTDMRARNTILAARQFARGEIGAAAMDAAWTASWTAARAAARAAAEDAEEKWQLERLIAWLSDEDLQDWPLPEVKP